MERDTQRDNEDKRQTKTNRYVERQSSETDGDIDRRWGWEVTEVERLGQRQRGEQREMDTVGQGGLRPQTSRI